MGGKGSRYKVICNDWDLFIFYIFDIFDKFGQLARLILLRMAYIWLWLLFSQCSCSFFQLFNLKLNRLNRNAEALADLCHPKLLGSWNRC